MQSSSNALMACPAVHFEIHHNGDRIIEINVSTDPSETVDISPDVASKTDGYIPPCFVPFLQTQWCQPLFCSNSLDTAVCHANTSMEDTPCCHCRQLIPAEFTYSVTWRESVVPFEKRMDKCVPGPCVACRAEHVMAALLCITPTVLVPHNVRDAHMPMLNLTMLS